MTEIRANPLKVIAGIFICLIFIGIGLVLQESTGTRRYPAAVAHAVGYFTIATGALGIGLMVTKLFRPDRLALDDQGFTASGGLYRKSTRVLWSDVKEFAIWRSSAGTKVVVYNLKPGSEAPASWINQKVANADGAFQLTLAMPVDELLRIVTDYHRRAAGGA